MKQRVTRRRSLACEVLIVGGGPAGLSAALMLGRCARQVLLCDAGQPRNRKTNAVHGLLSRDGSDPKDLLELGRRELRSYPGIAIRSCRVTKVRRMKSGFRAFLSDGRRVDAQRVLLATGVVDHLPALRGFESIYGRSAFHCPYCDAWEWRERRIAVYGRGSAGKALALKLSHWSRDVVVCTDGVSEWTARERGTLSRAGIPTIETRIASLASRGSKLGAIVFRDGRRLGRDVLFFTLGQTPLCSIAAELGCELTSKGEIRVSRKGSTSVSGLYVAGDVSSRSQFVATAIAEGAEAAVAIHESLIAEASRRR
ncbi:MAG TPA: NAD(P)/FAD-dependent oxidoreductase [Candidatus Limnocylindria bacterium]|nr:NAD(P)/FAD-dependent oxidoreductase [Candidatus Limnocylindria bacterium]